MLPHHWWTFPPGINNYTSEVLPQYPISPLPQFPIPIIPIFQHSIIPVVSAANLSSSYRNFHFAPCRGSLFTVVGFLGVRCIISNLKGSAYAPSPVTNDNQHKRFAQHRWSPAGGLLPGHVEFRISIEVGDGFGDFYVYIFAAVDFQGPLNPPSHKVFYGFIHFRE